MNGLPSLVPALALALLAPSARAATPEIRFEWNAPLTGNQGQTGPYVANLDGEGPAEIVTSSSDDFWYVLGFDGSGYRQKHASLPPEEGFDSVYVAQADADPELEVILLTNTDELFIYSGIDFTLERTLDLGFVYKRALAVADVDADGDFEVVYTNHDDLFVRDLVTGAIERQEEGLSADDISIGQADADAALEIAVETRGDTNYVLDGATMARELEIPGGNGREVELADVDGDGRAELVVLVRSAEIVVYDVELETAAYTVPDEDAYNLSVTDLDGDGASEILYLIHPFWMKALNGASGAELWTAPSPGSTLFRAQAGDTDGDGTRELVFGMFSQILTSENLVVTDASTLAVEWASSETVGPTYGLASGDVDGDGRRELLTTILRGHTWDVDGSYRVHDADTGRLEQQRLGSASPGGEGVRSVRTGNLDADPQEEICVGSGTPSDGKLYCRDGRTQALQWEASVEEGVTFSSLLIADVDGDSELEVVGGTGAEPSIGRPAHVYAYDGATGALEWKSADLGSPGHGMLPYLRIAEVDGTPVPEVVVATQWGEVYVLDGATGTVQISSSGLLVTALDTPDADGNGIAEILVGDLYGEIFAVDAATGAAGAPLTASPYTSGLNGIDGLIARDLTGDGVLDFLFGQLYYVLLYDGAADDVGWQSPYLSGVPGLHNSLEVLDADGDRQMEILVGTVHGPVMFEIAHPGELFFNDFESRDVSAWASSSP